MATSAKNGNGSNLLVVGDTGGVTVIDPTTPLKRLNYFDGKFLRADDFDVEQRYLRRLVATANHGLGPGVVYGYDATLGSGDTIQIGPGLAIDPSGNVLLLQTTVAQSIQALIDATNKPEATPPTATGKSGAGAFTDCVEVAAPSARPYALAAPHDVYVIAICAAEALCGQADVYGKLCEEACVTSTDRPYRLEGVVLRAIPLPLRTAEPTSSQVDLGDVKYLRSKIAYRWFRDEALKHRDAISAKGLSSDLWCLGADYSTACCEVPLAVVARSGTSAWFVDPWIVRRERMDAPARRYWQWTMRMRPWDAFLAQVLQFQCQLADLLPSLPPPGPHVFRPWAAKQYNAIHDAAELIAQMREQILAQASTVVLATSDTPAIAPSKSRALKIQTNMIPIASAKVDEVSNNLEAVLQLARKSATEARVLVDAGIIELPPAGYLPIVVGSTPVEDQVRALLGDGVDLRFCAAAPDYIARRVEAAQHMDRISLIQGLDDPSHMPRVDIFVPADVVVASAPAAAPVAAATAAPAAAPAGAVALATSETADNALSLRRGTRRQLAIGQKVQVEVPAIEPALDWVVFARRREKACKVVPVAVTSRRYRVLNVTVNANEAVRLLKMLQDPGARAGVIAKLLSGDSKHFVVTFTDASAAATTTASAIKAGWESLSPGTEIVYVAAGAVGETDALLQQKRVLAVESAISADSTASGLTKTDAFVPFPDAAKPSDADGIMLFVTMNLVVEQQHVFAADPDIYKIVLTAAGTVAGTTTVATTGTATGAPSLVDLLKSTRVVDLGVAKHSVGASGSLTVDSADVQSAFKKFGAQAGPSALVLLPSGSSSAENAVRANAALTVAKELGSTATPAAVTYAGTWPSADESSIVVIQTISK